jgi:hypothetical protein
MSLSYQQFWCCTVNSSISETVRNRTHVQYTFLLRMTDSVTSQNIDLSSWDTMYIVLIQIVCVINQAKTQHKKQCTIYFTALHAEVSDYFATASMISVIHTLHVAEDSLSVSWFCSASALSIQKTQSTLWSLNLLSY